MGEPRRLGSNSRYGHLGANWQRFALFADDGLTVQGRRSGTNQAHEAYGFISPIGLFPGARALGFCHRKQPTVANGALQLCRQLFFADRDLSGHGVSRLDTKGQQAVVHFPCRIQCNSLANYFSPIVI